MGAEDGGIGAAGQKLQNLTKNRGEGDFLVSHEFAKWEGSIREKHED